LITLQPTACFEVAYPLLEVRQVRSRILFGLLDRSGFALPNARRTHFLPYFQMPLMLPSPAEPISLLATEISIVS